jgi:hypothetical protein
MALPRYWKSARKEINSVNAARRKIRQDRKKLVIPSKRIEAIKRRRKAGWWFW